MPTPKKKPAKKAAAPKKVVAKEAATSEPTSTARCNHGW